MTNLLFLRNLNFVLAIAFVGTPALSQQITANVSGVDDTRDFAEICLQTAPSFSRAGMRQSGNFFVSVNDVESDAELPTHNAEGFEVEPENPHVRVNRWNAYHSAQLVEVGKTCTCSMTFTTGNDFVADFLNNFAVTIQREFARSYQSGSQDPMLFDFDDVITQLTIPTRQISDFAWEVTPQATREGSCPT